MRKINHVTALRRRRSHFRAADLVRPGGEAILLAGVALGCVQLGWGAIFPETYDPLPPSAATDDSQTLEARPLRSPFAPMAAPSADPASQRAAALNGVKVVGLRQAELAEDSGAILAFPDGLQRPFLVGHEIAEGVVLSRVESGRVVVAFDGGEMALPVEGAASTGSFALALMGRSTAPYGTSPVVEVQPVAAPAPASAPTPVLPTAAPAAIPAASAADAQWLASTMSQIEMRDGEPYGWRVAAAPPKAAADAGLTVGDLILSVNGNPPSAPDAVMAAASAREIRIAVERPSGERKIMTLPNGMAS
jgi:hypothetical protein